MGKCNIPTCRSQDPRDCDGCAGKDPVPLKKYKVTIGVNPRDGTSCDTGCPHLQVSRNDPAKCLLFAETIGSSTRPCRCRACVRFTMEMADKNGN
jgi:hypothetical protein